MRNALELTPLSVAPSLCSGMRRHQTNRGGRISAPASAGMLMMLLAMLCAQPTGAANPPQILVFGDSLAAGFGLSPEASFPVRLEARLAADGSRARVVNSGNSGDTTAAGLARLDWALADKPHLVILELGANDALRGIDPESVR